jgi:long-chain acyl-CoA synthetase
MVFGDRRPFLVAVLVPDPEFAGAFARQHGAAAELPALAHNPAFHQALGDAVARINQELAPIERVRRFIIAHEPFSIDNAQMTPTLKIRRHAIRAAYEAKFDSLYEGKGMAA